MPIVTKSKEKRRVDSARPGLWYLVAFGLLISAVAGRCVSLAQANDGGSDSAHEGAIAPGEIIDLDEPQFPRNEPDRPGDTVDYYAFQIAYPATVGLGLRQLDFDADLFL